MSKYRIIKLAGFKYQYAVQQKIMGLFWWTIRDFSNLPLAEFWVKDTMAMHEYRKNNKKNIVIKEF